MTTQKATSGIGEKVAGGVAKGALKLVSATGKRLLSSATDRIGETTERLTDFTENGGGSGLMGAITGRGGNGGGGGAKDKSLKVTNIVETVDIGAPVRVVYDQWTRFTEFPTFMKKVETVQQESDEKLTWKAQVLWSHRTWESTIVEQVPDKRIVWQSEGEKGTVDGAVTFHELGPELTRVLLNLQYHPQGFFERTGNLWRAQGRRARLELKHFARHVMNDAVLRADEVEGWRGEIHDGEVTKDNDTAKAEEERAAQGEQGEQSSAEPEAEREQRAPSGPRREAKDRSSDERRRRPDRPESGREARPRKDASSERRPRERAESRRSAS